MALSAGTNEMNIGCLVGSPHAMSLSSSYYTYCKTANMLPSFGKDDTGQYSEDSPSDNEIAEIVQVHIKIYMAKSVY